MIGNSFYLDYGYIVYDQPNNETFYQRLQSFKYSTAVGSARAFMGEVSNLDKLFQTIYLCWLFCDLAKGATRV